MQVNTKFKVGKYLLPVQLVYVEGRIEIHFGFSRDLIAEVKSMEGHKWHGFEEPNPRKIWSVKDSLRNAFRIDLLQGKNPYARYDRPMPEIETTRPLYDHQKTMVSHALTRQYAIFACEMGTGKSLAFIEMLDHIDDLEDHEIWYIGPKSGVKAVRREFIKWNSQYRPEFMTYMGLVKRMREWEPGEPAPRVVCFDESSRIKTPTSKRSQAALHLANAVRSDWGEAGHVLLMSGTPAPKAPTDWWHQAEVACPGYLKEGTIGKFKMRLSLVEQRQSISGGSYPHLVTWLDDEWKCAKCGKRSGEPEHKLGHFAFEHEFKKSKNEVAYLHKRLADLALVMFKKDCLDLPEKQYKYIKVRPTVETLQAARLIRRTSTRAIQALGDLRQLSDGFQYKEEVTGKKICEGCGGRRVRRGRVPRENVNTLDPLDVNRDDFVDGEVECTVCDEDGMMDVVSRTTHEIATPKDEAFIELLEDHEDVGRFVAWGGFTATLDRIIRIAHQYGWATLRIDKLGYNAMTPTGEVVDSKDFLDAMDATNPRRQELLETYPKVLVVGHPKAGGMGLTFNMSPGAVFYSNSFSGEDRMQAEDRIHRIGMDENRGATIFDLIHLGTDDLVLQNLMKKKRLQDLTLGELDSLLEG
jgi:SNF2 family DNA or RNA helicase